MTGCIYQNLKKKGKKADYLLEERALLKQLTESVVSPICQTLAKETHQCGHSKGGAELQARALRGLITQALCPSCCYQSWQGTVAAASGEEEITRLMPPNN